MSVKLQPKLITFIIPIFNEEQVFPYLQARLIDVAKKLACEVEWIFVNDGSKDRTLLLLLEWASADSRVKVLDFSRNFGHQAGITAGLDHASGDVVVIMDGDLQDPPELVIEMMGKYFDGYDVVYAQRISRAGESFFKRCTAAVFYWLMRNYVHPDLPMNTGDFRLMSRKAADSLNTLREGQRFVRGMVSWLGFRQISQPFERPARAVGTTKFPIGKMVRFAWDAVLSFSSAPLKLGLYIGGALFCLGVGVSIHATILKLIYKDIVPGWASLIVLTSIIGGSILVCLGLVGEYVGRIYEELKGRPIYIVRQAFNVEPRALPLRAVVTEYRSATTISDDTHALKIAHSK